MKKLLLVDDDPEILQGLRRMLRVMRGEWTVDFAESGPQALETMEREDFDLIVCDMRMPGMDGVQLLQEVRRLHPRTVRIILSGHSDQEHIMSSIKPAHQFLAKPIDQGALVAVLRKALVLQEMLTDTALTRLLSQVEALPALPHVYTQLLEEINSDRSSLEAVGRIIEQDMGMTATILKVINSAFFGLPRRIEKPAQAVGLLGLEVIKSLVLSYQVFSSFDFRGIKGFSFDALWRHSVAVGGLARQIAQMEGLERRQIEEAFIAGMLHDVGKLPLAALVPVRYEQVLARVRQDNRLLWEVEMEELGTSHAEVGAYLMGLWGLSEGVILSLAYHHRPSRATIRHFSTLTAVHAADVLEHELVVTNKGYAQPQWDQDHLAKIGISNQVQAWRVTCAESLGVEAPHEAV